MKKMIVFTTILLFVAGFGLAQSKFNFFFMGNVPLYSQTDSISWSANWSHKWLESITERGVTDIENKAKIPGFGAGFSYLFTDNLGIEVRVDYMNSDAEVTASYNVNWEWSSSTSSNSETYTFPNIETGSLSVMPISLNIFYKAQTESYLTPYISGGLSYFNGNYEVNTRSMYAYPYEYTSQGYNWIDIEWWTFDYKIDESISGIGGNIGGGVDLRLMEVFSIGIEARYFVGPKVDDLQWEIVRKDYYTEEFHLRSTNGILNNAEELINKEQTFSINTSFPMIAFRVVIYI